MSNSWNEREKAFEEGYFKQKDNELIAKMRANLAVTATTAKTLDCPKCDGKLKTSDFETVQIDVCEQCSGVWLDAGEMQLIMSKDNAQDSWFKRLFD